MHDREDRSDNRPHFSKQDWKDIFSLRDEIEGENDKILLRKIIRYTEYLEFCIRQSRSILPKIPRKSGSLYDMICDKYSERKDMRDVYSFLGAEMNNRHGSDWMELNFSGRVLSQDERKKRDLLRADEDDFKKFAKEINYANPTQAWKYIIDHSKKATK